MPTRFAAVMPKPETAATTSSRLLSTPEPTVTEKIASSGCAVELCEAVTVTVLLASCASRGAAGVKSKTMTRRRDINRFYYARHVLKRIMALDLCPQIGRAALSRSIV